MEPIAELKNEHRGEESMLRIIEAVSAKPSRRPPWTTLPCWAGILKRKKACFSRWRSTCWAWTNKPSCRRHLKSSRKTASDRENTRNFTSFYIGWKRFTTVSALT